MKKLIKSHCQDVDIAFAQNGWINATGIAEKFDAVNRADLPESDLNRLARLEVYNTLLIGNGLNYDERKKAIECFATDCRTPRIAATKTAAIEMSMPA